MLQIFFLDVDEYQFSEDIRSSISEILMTADTDVRKLLPGLAKHLNVTVFPTKSVIPETGETARTPNKNWIQWAVNPWANKSIEDILAKELRKTFFHEANHAARMQSIKWHGTIIADAIFEGLGTVFERDFAGSESPWGQYDVSNIRDWTREVIALDSDAANRQHWFNDHPDGRKWIAYKVGTFVVDEAIKNSHETPTTLVEKPAQEIVELARI